MPYRAPGAYAQFVKRAGAVSSVGSRRILAIVGTGNLMYDVIDEVVERDQDRSLKVTPYDILANDSIFEIQSISDKKRISGVFPAGTNTWEKGKHFDLKEGKYIVWHTDPANPATVTKKVGVGNDDFSNFVTILPENDREFLMEDGVFKIEVTYVDSVAGAYKVVDTRTNEVIGEYGVSVDGQTGVIPGVKLTVTSTFFDNGSGESSIQIGDYVIIETKAAVVPAQYVELDGVTGDPVIGTEKDLPQHGDLYYVTYTYKKSEDGFQPKMFMDLLDVQEEYGSYDVTASGKVINSLTLGAEIAFSNGAAPIVCVQAKGDSDYEIKAAIDKLRRGIVGLANTHVVVPLTTSEAVGSHLMNHVIDMSSPDNGKERMAYLAVGKDKTPLEIATLAKNFNHERVVLVAPSGAYKDIRDSNNRIVERLVDASFLAVAVASLGIKNDPAEPFTNKTISGFNRLNSLYEESEMNIMADAGTLILKQQGPNIKIRHGVTTAAKDVNTAEITLIQIKDYVIEEVRSTLGELYIGNKLRPTIIADVESSLISMLNQFITQQVILGFSGISVRRSKDDPRQIDVKFEIEAVYPLNYIVIEFGFSEVK